MVVVKRAKHADIHYYIGPDVAFNADVNIRECDNVAHDSYYDSFSFDFAHLCQQSEQCRLNCMYIYLYMYIYIDILRDCDTHVLEGPNSLYCLHTIIFVVNVNPQTNKQIGGFSGRLRLNKGQCRGAHVVATHAPQVNVS